MKRKINLRLELVALIAIITTTIGISLVYYNLFQNQVRNDLKLNAGLLLETEIFQHRYNAGKVVGSDPDRLHPGGLHITWVDEDGTVLFDNDIDTADLSNHLNRPEVRMALTSGEGESVRRSDTMEMNTFYYALLLENGTVLRVSTQAKAITGVLLTALPVIAVIMAITLLGCVLIGHFLTTKLLEPLEDMAKNPDNIHIHTYRELEPFVNKIRIQHENILAAAKSRQDFTANVTHELKTPIMAISGYAELIENRMVDIESETYIAQQIRHNADRLQSLVTDIIQLSELDRQESFGKFEVVDLYAVAAECVEDLRPLADRESVKMTCEGRSTVINADRALIREMIENLVQNAIRYNRENGMVYVHVAVRGNHPMISVKDNGLGIPADQQERAFERFYRVDKSRSRQTGGTGLGLAIVKHIAEIHTAEITMESVPEEGTEIVVHFHG